MNHVKEEKVFSPEEKRKLVRETLKLAQHPVLKKRKDLHERVVDIFVKNFGVISTYPGQCGKTYLVECKIELKPGAKPVRQNSRPMAPPLGQNFEHSWTRCWSRALWRRPRARGLALSSL